MKYFILLVLLSIFVSGFVYKIGWFSKKEPVFVYDWALSPQEKVLVSMAEDAIRQDISPNKRSSGEFSLTAISHDENNPDVFYVQYKVKSVMLKSLSVTVNIKTKKALEIRETIG